MNKEIALKIKEEFPQGLKNIIKDANQFVLQYLQNVYGNKEEFSLHYNKIINLFKTIEYKLTVEVSGDNASYSNHDNSITIYETLTRNFNNLNDESYLINLGTLIHELSHAISYLLPKIPMVRYEEGIADLLADRVLEFVRTNNLLKEISNSQLEEKPYKETAYHSAGSIIRSLAILSNNNDRDILWDYLFENNYLTPKETAIFNNIKVATNEEMASTFVSIELMLKDKNYLTKKEEKSLKELLKNVDINSIPSHLIQTNNLLQEIIYERIKELKIEDKQEILKMFPNLPKSFFENYEVLLTKLSFLIESTVEEYGNDADKTKSQLNEIINLFFKDINIDDIKDYPSQPNKHNVMISFLLKTLKYDKCFFEYNLELGTLIPILINYDILYNGQTLEESEKDIQDILSTFGFKRNEHHALELWTMIRKQNSLFQNKTKDEIFEEIKKVLMTNLSNAIYFENIKRKYNDDKIDENKFVNQTFKMFMIAKNDGINYPTSLILKFIKTIVQKHSKNVNSLNPQFINSCLPSLQDLVNLVELPFDFNITSYVLTASLKDEPSINQFFKLMGSQDLHIKNDQQMNEILMQVLLDSMGNLSLEELSTIIDLSNSEYYAVNKKELRTEVYNGYIDDNGLLKSIHANLRVNIKNKYINGDIDTKNAMFSDDKWYRYIINGYDDLSEATQKELFIYELQTLEGNEKARTMIDKINSEKEMNFYFTNLKNVISETSFSDSLEHKNSLEKLKNTPMLYWMYYRELLPPYKYDTFSFFSLDSSFDKYIKYKDLLPGISQVWLKEFEFQKQFLQDGKLKKEELYDCKSFLSNLLDKLNGGEPSWDESTSHLIIEKILLIVNETISEVSCKEKLDNFELLCLRSIGKSLAQIQQYFDIKMISSIINSVNAINSNEQLSQLKK